MNPERVLLEMFKFILAERDLSGTIIEKRIKDVLNQGNNYLYKPRQAGGGFHKHVDKVEKGQYQALMDNLEHYLHFFGYAKHETTPEVDASRLARGLNKFEFYDFNGGASKESVASYMDFEQLNAKMLDLRISLKQAGKIKTLTLNKDDVGFNMLVEKELAKFGAL
eukprot:CAMPEP_0170501540 /NCGR_PEP_ID=MMETSP0208-20121228/38610_1 /TAXON_ID=197538 /ORGANISM="Strombidium inclinatum, Strain S3" /LENGTH=165 /DNA_ID=CAMNT_0010780145 /DNA_START=963 /DNA_END=1457 /DNA_ORIENTATION=+